MTLNKRMRVAQGADKILYAAGVLFHSQSDSRRFAGRVIANIAGMAPETHQYPPQDPYGFPARDRLKAAGRELP